MPMGANLSANTAVREGHPLKQGLKLEQFYRSTTTTVVREGHPLKQGLKRPGIWHQHFPQGGSGRTSTKTRIETPFPMSNHPPCRWVREGHPLKQGLKQAG